MAPAIFRRALSLCSACASSRTVSHLISLSAPIENFVTLLCYFSVSNTVNVTITAKHIERIVKSNLISSRPATTYTVFLSSKIVLIIFSPPTAIMLLFLEKIKHYCFLRDRYIKIRFLIKLEIQKWIKQNLRAHR